MTSPEPSPTVKPLAAKDSNAATSDVAYRRFMIAEARTQTLLLQEIRDHFASWAPEEG